MRATNVSVDESAWLGWLVMALALSFFWPLFLAFARLAVVRLRLPLMVALVTHWIETGIADRIITAIRSEAVGRQQLAQRALKGFEFQAKPAAHHLWLLLPEGRPDVAAQLLRNGLAVVAGEAFTVDGTAPHAARVSLGAARNRAELTEALRILVSALHRPADTRQIV